MFTFFQEENYAQRLPFWGLLATRVHADIVGTDNDFACAVGPPLSATDRAARELEEFTMRVHADVDPNAPAYVKPSPSVSGDDAGLSSQAPTCLTCPHTCSCFFGRDSCTKAPILGRGLQLSR